jgi:predicted acylesterase/phospholipase RssA
VPWLFAPVTIGTREYVDGGVWSPTNLDAAPAGRDTHVLCLNPTASLATITPEMLEEARARGGSARISHFALRDAGRMAP